MKPANDISWFIGYRGVTLSSRGGNIHFSIPYPHAALWAGIANGNYRQDWAIDVLSILLDTDKVAARVRS